jgi:thiamine kinase-like enzyme
MSEYLEQTRKYTRGQYKYSLDCDKIKSNPDSLQILNGSVRAKHTIIMNAVSKEMNGKVVVKIGKTNELIKQEYDVAKQLETADIDGFIRIQCLFSCGHDLSKYNNEIEPTTFKICETTKTSNIDVLIMPYIVSPNGNATTLHNYLETGGDTIKYKTIIRDVIANLCKAFLKTGFVHKDLHFGNVLIDTTGEPIIIDFDTSEFVNPAVSHAYFWSDIHRFFSHVIEKSYPTNLKSYSLTNAQPIFTIINTLLIAGTITNINAQVHNIITLINASDVLVIDNVPTKYVYNPNIFGGKVKRTKRNKKLHKL